MLSKSKKIQLNYIISFLVLIHARLKILDSLSLKILVDNISIFPPSVLLKWGASNHVLYTPRITYFNNTFKNGVAYECDFLFWRYFAEFKKFRVSIDNNTIWKNNIINQGPCSYKTLIFSKKTLLNVMTSCSADREGSLEGWWKGPLASWKFYESHMPGYERAIREFGHIDGVSRYRYNYHAIPG